MDVVTAIKCLCCLDDGGRGEVFRVLPLYVIECRFSIAAYNRFDGRTDVMRIAADRLDDSFPLMDDARALWCFGGYHQASNQLIVTLFLEVPQVKRVVVHLVVCALAVLFVTNLELQQEYDVAVQYRCVHPFSHAGGSCTQK